MKFAKILRTPILKNICITTTSEFFILSFSRKWSLSPSNKFLFSANTLTVLLFCGGNVGPWFGLTNVNTEGGSLALSLPQSSFVG